MTTRILTEEKAIICNKDVTNEQLDQMISKKTKDGAKADVVISLGAKNVEEHLPRMMKILQTHRANTNVLCDPVTANLADPTADGIEADAKYEIHQTMRIANDHRMSVKLALKEDESERLTLPQVNNIRNSYNMFAEAYGCVPA